MAWIQLRIHTHRDNADMLGDLLMDQGSVSITYEDGQDEHGRLDRGADAVEHEPALRQDRAFLDVGRELAGLAQQLTGRRRDVGVALDDGGAGRVDREHAHPPEAGERTVGGAADHQSGGERRGAGRELLDRGGLYADLWSRQSRAHEDADAAVKAERVA